jgi:hypothetical protein
MNDALGNFLQAILLDAVRFLLPFFLFWLAKEIAVVWAQIKASKPALAKALADGAPLAVQAAEQLGILKLIDDKKEYAVNYLQSLLDHDGLKNVNVAIVEGAIEAAVHAADFPHLTAEPVAPTPVVTPTPSS